MYPEELVVPRKQDLTEYGFNEVLTAEQVDDAIKGEGTTFVVINSVCGCAAANARPAAKLALQNEKKPTKAVTAFAGFDLEAINRIRAHAVPFPPSSPCMGLWKDGELVHFVERHHIEGNAAEMIAENIKAAFDKYC